MISIASKNRQSVNSLSSKKGNRKYGQGNLIKLTSNTSLNNQKSEA